MQIGTGNSDPVSQKQYPIAMKHYDWVKDKIKKLSDMKKKDIDVKVIIGSHSSWSALIIIVHNDDGGKCLLIDYRALNKADQKFIWLLPKIKDIFSKVFKYFSLDYFKDQSKFL